MQKEYDIGEKPGKGTYECIYSGHKDDLKDNEPLPPCPSNKCKWNHPDTKWKKAD